MPRRATAHRGLWRQSPLPPTLRLTLPPTRQADATGLDARRGARRSTFANHKVSSQRPAADAKIRTNAGRSELPERPRSHYRGTREGWRDEVVALSSARSSTDPDGLHQQSLLVPSLWGGSGPRHPRDAQSVRRGPSAPGATNLCLLARVPSAAAAPLPQGRRRDEPTSGETIDRSRARRSPYQDRPRLERARQFRSSGETQVIARVPRSAALPGMGMTRVRGRRVRRRA